MKAVHFQRKDPQYPSPFKGRGLGEGWFPKDRMNTEFEFPLTLILSPRGRGVFENFAGLKNFLTSYPWVAL